MCHFLSHFISQSKEHDFSCLQSRQGSTVLSYACKVKNQSICKQLERFPKREMDFVFGDGKGLPKSKNSASEP